MHLRPVPVLPRQRGLVTSSQLGAAGLDAGDVRRLLKAGRLVSVRRSVYVDADVWDDADPFTDRPLLRVHAARLTIRASPIVFSHDSAAIALRMGAPSPSDALVHVTRPKVHGDRVRAGIKHHLAPYRPDEVATVDGLDVLRPSRTALDMVREHGRVAGLAACDAALRSGMPREELADAFSRMGSWPHSRTMRWCIEMADGGAESYLESQGRDLVLELGIGRPQTQFGLTDGERVVWCDTRVHRHLFEMDGRLKYASANGDDPDVVLLEEKRRQDFITGFKLGMSRITAYDCGPGRAAARRRLMREYVDTCQRFGTSVADLERFVVPSSRRVRAG